MNETMWVATMDEDGGPSKVLGVFRTSEDAMRALDGEEGLFWDELNAREYAVNGEKTGRLWWRRVLGGTWDCPVST